LCSFQSLIRLREEKNRRTQHKLGPRREDKIQGQYQSLETSKCAFYVYFHGLAGGLFYCCNCQKDKHGWSGYDQRGCSHCKRQRTQQNESKETERKEAERKKAERKETESKETERKGAESESHCKRQRTEETERKETERKETERKETERKEAERKEAERESLRKEGEARKVAELRDVNIKLANALAEAKSARHEKDRAVAETLGAREEADAARKKAETEADGLRLELDGARLRELQLITHEAVRAVLDTPQGLPRGFLRDDESEILGGPRWVFPQDPRFEGAGCICRARLRPQHTVSSRT